MRGKQDRTGSGQESRARQQVTGVSDDITLAQTTDSITHRSVTCTVTDPTDCLFLISLSSLQMEKAGSTKLLTFMIYTLSGKW